MYTCYNICIPVIIYVYLLYYMYTCYNICIPVIIYVYVKQHSTFKPLLPVWQRYGWLFHATCTEIY